MIRAHRIIIAGFIVILLSVLNPVTGNATIGRMPSEAEQEISEIEDESYAVECLDGDVVEKIAASAKLAQIGTSSSLPPLLARAIDINEDRKVRVAASKAIWKIRLREATSSGGASSAKNLFLSIIDLYEKVQGSGTYIDSETGISITPQSDGGQWLVEDGAYKQVATDSEYHIRDYSDVTKTPQVINWAMLNLGNMGSLEAVDSLQAFLFDSEITPFSEGLKRTAKESLAKIEHINNPYVTDKVEGGLVHPELCVRIWALGMLVEENSYNLEYLIERLVSLFTEAEEKNDNKFASHISQAMEDVIKEYNSPPPIEIISPQDDPDCISPIKTPYVEVFGRIHGEPFCETEPLTFLGTPDNPGRNTYTKTITDIDGSYVSETITIYHANASPEIRTVGGREIFPGQNLDFTVNEDMYINISVFATDSDDSDLLYFAYYDLLEGADFTADTFTWTPGSADVGVHEVTFEVDDTNGLTDRVTVTINVTGQYQLTGRDILSGSGSITIDPDQEYYDDGTIITLTAIPDAGHKFYSWSSYPYDLVYQSPTTELEIHQDTYISVFFKPVTTDVYLNLPEGANGCYFDNSYYTSNETITGVAMGQYSLSIDYDSSYWLFSNWFTSGDCSIDDTSNYSTTIYITGTSPVTIEAYLSSNAYFDSVLQQWQITGRYASTGLGSITIDPDQDYYADGTTVTLTANPDEGYQFYSWSSYPYEILDWSQENSISFEIHQDTFVSVDFNPLPQTQAILLPEVNQEPVSLKAEPLPEIDEQPVPSIIEVSPETSQQPSSSVAEAPTKVIQHPASFATKPLPDISQQQPDCSIKIEPHSRNKYRFRFTSETKLSQRKIKSYYWDFGDGKTSKWREVWHRYKKPGTYTVSFTVVDKNGEELKAKTETIVIPEH